MNIVSFSKQETASLLFSGGIQFFLDLPFLVLVTAYLLELGPHKNRGEACPSVCVFSGCRPSVWECGGVK